MSWSKVQPFFSKRRLRKLEQKMLSMQVEVPEIVSDWHLNQPSSDIQACIGYLMIEEELRPPDMLNPCDIVDQRIPEGGFEWAVRHVKRARAIEEAIKDYSQMDSWVLLVLNIYKFWEKKQAELADFLKEGNEPLHISQFVEGKPYKLPGEDREYFNPALNYRKKPKK